VKDTLFCVIKQGRKQIFIHEVNVPEPSLPMKAPKTRTFYDISDWPERIRHKSRTKIHATEAPVQRMGRQNSHCRPSQKIGCDFIEFIEEGLFRPAGPQAFLESSDFASPFPAVLFIENR
jgi:hypothetical protein